MNFEVQQTLEQAADAGTCCRKRVGCVVTAPGSNGSEIIVVGSNGRPGDNTCAEGHCPRCEATEHFDHGRGHDLCSCVHAEQNAITKAARTGVALEGADLYSTYQPCLTCLKLVVDAGINKVFYYEPWIVPDVPEVPELASDYEQLGSQLPGGFEKLQN